MAFNFNKEICLVLFIIVAQNSVMSENIKFIPCSNNVSEITCDIERVIVDPCPEALNEIETPCNYYRGTNVSLKVEFKPKFSSTKLSVHRYNVLAVIDLPDLTYTTNNACEFTQCPVSPGNLYTFKQIQHIESFYPAGQFLAKWVISGEQDKQKCCFKTNVKII